MTLSSAVVPASAVFAASAASGSNVASSAFAISAVVASHRAHSTKKNLQNKYEPNLYIYKFFLRFTNYKNFSGLFKS